ncbi:hypothetical protein CEXT_558741 [Caerostris extrusa]|uniref:Uncharacterized protein n=1 Tax=Caerostris extrusa TaxID=172846 RepID=A0AAV4RR70_CAEEX|nr:hypothetical protein CEXT_558741 [Caerostris extrusa]
MGMGALRVPLNNPHYGVASCNGVDESFSKNTACREDWLQLTQWTRSLTGKDDEPCREAQLKGNERSRRPQLLSLFPDSARSGGGPPERRLAVNRLSIPVEWISISSVNEGLFSKESFWKNLTDQIIIKGTEKEGTSNATPTIVKNRYGASLETFLKDYHHEQET